MPGQRNFEQTFEWTYEHSYHQQHYESKVSSDKTTGNISTKTDQFIISNENTLEAKQNETQLDLVDGNRSRGKLQKRRSRSKSTVLAKAPAVIENHRDYGGRKF